MGCLAAVFGLITPRFVLFLLWAFTNYLSRAFDTFLWPTLGFFFLPTTTIGYAVARNEFNGLKGWGLVVFVIGILVDFGLLGGGSKARRRA